MTWPRLVRAEIRKLSTTRMPWGFLIILVIISATTATAVIVGEDMDGTKGFIATAADQQSLMAFGANAMMIAGLFGAIAVAREYGHGTVVPTFLAAPRRHRAVLAQYTAIALAGGLLGLVGATLSAVVVAISVPIVDYDFLVSAADLTQVLAASTFAGAAGALLGAGLGAVVRNTGGAVTAAVLLLIIVPPIVVQLASQAADWVPSVLANVLSGVAEQPDLLSALAALAAWGLIPAAIGLVAVQRRDVV
jgi:ABC-type transport system involved in multi-copper enzyme maturation permease subunit